MTPTTLAYIALSATLVLIGLLIRAHARIEARREERDAERRLSQRMHSDNAALAAKYARLTDRDAKGRFVRR